MHVRHWIPTLATMLVASAGAITQGAPAASASLAPRVPGGAVAFVEYTGLNPALRDSVAGQLAQTPAVAQLMAFARANLSRAFPESREVRAAYQAGWEMAQLLGKHPVAIAVLDLPNPRSMLPVPEMVLLAELGDDAQAFRAQLTKLLQAVGLDMLLTDATHKGVTYRTIAPVPGASFALGFKGTMFFVTSGPGTAADVLDTTPATSLQAQHAYRNALREVDGEDVFLRGWFDAKSIRAKRRALLGTTAGPGRKVEEVLSALGLNRMTALAGTIRVVDRGMLTKVKVFTPAPHRGLLFGFSGKPVTPAQIASIPADAEFAVVSNVPTQRVLLEVERLRRMMATDGPLTADTDSVIAAIRRETNIDLDRDLMANFGSSWRLVSSPSYGGSVTGTVLSVELTRPKPVGAGLGRFEKFLAGVTKGQIEFGTVPAASPIRRMTFSEYPVPFAPSWSIHKNRLYLAGWPQVLQTALADEALPKLSDLPRYQWMRKHLTTQPTSLLWVRPARLLQGIYNYSLLTWTALTGSSYMPSPFSQLPIQGHPEMFPPLSSVRRFLWPMVASLSNDATGVTYESYGSLPAMGLDVVPMQVPLIAGGLPVWLRSAQEASKLDSAVYRCGRIARAISSFARDRNAWPRNLAVLVDQEHLWGVEELASPFHTGPMPRIVEGRLEGETDYVYLKPSVAPRRIRLRRNVVLVYEKLRNYSDRGTVVGFADGSSRFLTAAELQHALNVSEQELRRSARPIGSDL